MAYNIRIEGGGEFIVAAGEDSLLRGALRNGIGFPHECSVGGCGSCRFELLAGSMETLWAEAPGLSERDRRKGKRLACQCRPLEDCTIRVRTGAEYQPAVPPRRIEVSLVQRRPLTADTAEFGFQAATPATFLPGQYALMQLPGVTGLRAYSMSNLANGDGLWQFIIRRVAGGAGTTALFDRLGIGDRIVLDGPYGMAWWRPQVERESVCIAGGSGLAPMLAIARAALAGADGAPLHFFYGARTPADLCAGPMLADLPGATARLRFHPVLSHSTGDDGWTGARGFVHQLLTARLARPLPEYEFYFAGPPPMIEAVQQLLMLENKVPFAQIHFDRFV